MLRFANIYHEGECGQFRANEEQMGWKGESGTTVALAMNAVRKAEWLEGKLRILAETEEDGEHVVGLDGFNPKDYDALWRHFEESSGVYIKKHKAVAAINAADFDLSMRAIEDAADMVDEATPGSVMKKSREADLMKKVEAIRDGLGQAVSGDKQALSSVFSVAGCERIGRLRLVIDTVQLEGDFRKDPRWGHLKKMTSTVEGVLVEVGSYRPWKPPEDGSMGKRQMARELRQRMGQDDDEEEEPAPAPAPPARTGGVAAMAAQMAAGGMMPYGVSPAYQAEAQQEEEEEEEEPQPPAPAPPPPMPEPQPAPAPAPAAPSRGMGAPVESDSDDDRGNIFEDAAPKGPIAGAAGGGLNNDEEVSDPNARSAAPAGEDRRFKRLVGAAVDSDDDDGKDHSKSMKSYPDSILEGWIWKQSRWLKQWKRRYLVLRPESLMTFKQRRSPDSTEQFPSITNVYNADGEVKGLSRVFAVVSKGRSYYVICDDNETKDIWISNIQKTFCGAGQ